ncbi:MAG: alpha/beta hydrolase [Roseivivax sp.]|nr:alpha/beta hydrolase [Roseivivax sp.]
MLGPAPYHAELAEGPDGAHAVWAQADDGVRLRFGIFPAQKARGTVLLFPGRTEYIEKYGRTATDLVAEGYSVLIVDWRGQGLADRLTSNPRVGHVGTFLDYQIDVDTAVAAAEALKLPKPWHLVAHSMGGAIGLRALLRHLPVESAVFTGPMWGIRFSAVVRPAAWALSWSGTRSGLGHFAVPGTKPESYVATQPFEDNVLTTDPEMFEMMRRQAVAEPQFQLGGPSLQWLNEALAECLALSHLPSPDLRCLTFVGQQERIVDVARIRARMAAWPKGMLLSVPRAEHEVLMEGPAVRRCVTEQCIALFEGREITGGALAIPA